MQVKINLHMSSVPLKLVFLDIEMTSWHPYLFVPILCKIYSFEILLLLF